MLLKFQIVFCAAASLFVSIVAQTSPNRPGPFVSCSGIAVGSCPGSSGCCTVGACCGAGCCSPTEMCVFAGTARAGCCPFNDPTLCGSKASSPSPSSSGTLSNTPVDDPTCTRIRNCVNSSGTWTCLLGKPCGLFKDSCGTCPALTANASPLPTTRATSVVGVSTIRSASGGSVVGARTSSGFVQGSVIPGGSPTSGLISLANSADGSSQTSRSTALAAQQSAEIRSWGALAALVPALILAA